MWGRIGLIERWQEAGWCETIPHTKLLQKENDMSTRSVVAIPQGDGWKGRYVHSDGYPEHMVPTLMDLINRKGVDRVIDVLINWNPGWSFIGTYDGMTNYLGESRAHFVSDYGIAYSRAEQSMDSWYTDQDSNAMWIEYVYILGPKSITVLESYEATDGNYKHRLLNTVSYDSLIGV